MASLSRRFPGLVGAQIVAGGKNLHERDSRRGSIGHMMGRGVVAVPMIELRSDGIRDSTAPFSELRRSLRFWVLSVALLVAEEDITAGVSFQRRDSRSRSMYLREKVFSQTEQRYGRSLVSGDKSASSGSCSSSHGNHPRDLSCRLRCSVLVKRRWHTEQVLSTMVTDWN